MCETVARKGIEGEIAVRMISEETQFGDFRLEGKMRDLVSSFRLIFLSSQTIFPLQKAKTSTVFEFERRVVQLKRMVNCDSNYFS